MRVSETTFSFVLARKALKNARILENAKIAVKIFRSANLP
jgi:hypothetical protein